MECQLSVSCKCYEAAHEILLFSNLKEQNPEQYTQVVKRMGNIQNEIGVFYMNQAAALQSERVGKYIYMCVYFSHVYMYLFCWYFKHGSTIARKQSQK